MSEQAQFKARCDRFNVVKTLGSGAYSKVKLAVDSETGQRVALKILTIPNQRIQEKFVEMVSNEVNMMSRLAHPNVVNLVAVSESGTYTKRDGTSKNVMYIALELCTGGELFEYVYVTGRFQENLARTFFHQLVGGIEHCHKSGIAHRDLKPENLLFNQDFALKIADFGFSVLLTGRDGSGKLRTKLGTESYMAPEIHLGQAYNGVSVDLFACGIILFIMVSQNPPFQKANPQQDPYFKLLCTNRHEDFWRQHSKNKPGKDNFYSEDFKSLINSMLAFEPVQRLSVAEIKAHPWFRGATCSPEEVIEELNRRKMCVDRAAEEEQERKRAERERMQQGNRVGVGYGAGYGNPQFRDVAINRNEQEAGIEMNADLQQVMQAKRTAETYERFTAKCTEFFTTSSADDMFAILFNYAKSKATDFKVSDDSYKIKVSHVTEEDRIEFTIKILAAENKTNCVEFTRKRGQALEFHNIFNSYKKDLDAFVDATGH
mmetsp:Transcript_40911/g.47038  ORF Transcript_40911/g.47038 Transcript_40911/m.47038 type:complete len:488 (-) Transcript_40911:410-1873(-)|eukprot:CAMPEP_0114988366 /NCGR_PEP_ID=MMETSP0216-20121206/9556_1 /TAXON_ID=223996 /ORGANISM="Protocruzia adherens, Strain Boccale" /LENGTH=487 /DNA_ID=CAMNT_0002351133 /DNA_START=245 /DNA_END=1708 /DNA_ORIENTATION=-